MKSLYDSADRDAMLTRLAALRPDSPRAWGKMNPAQMLRHCSLALEAATGDRPMKQKLIGKILAPFVRSAALGEKPFGKNGPTDPTFVVSDPCEFANEQQRLLALIDRFAQRGPEQAATQTHAFFGKLSGQEWGELMHKHIDHHLRQFGT